MSWFSPYFSKSAETLKKHPKYSNWIPKIEVVSKIHTLVPPDVSENILDTVYEALFEEKQILIKYQKFASSAVEEMKADPLGMIFRENSIYIHWRKT